MDIGTHPCVRVDRFLVVLIINLHLVIVGIVFAIQIAAALVLFITARKNVVDILVRLLVAFRIGEKEVLVPDREAGLDIPASSNHILDDVKVCGYKLRLAVASVLNAMTDDVIHGLLQERSVAGEV